MLYLALPDPRGLYQDAGANRFRLAKLSDRTQVTGPRTPLTADTETAAALAAGLTLLPGALAAAQAARRQELGTRLRADLLAIFNGWTVGEQYDFDGARQALNEDLRKGALARAIAGVQTFRPNDGTIDAHRAQVLAALQAAAARFAAVAAAIAPEEVAAA